MNVRLLVVEDDAKLRDVLRRGLVEEGFAVDVTGRGVDALWQLARLHEAGLIRFGRAPENVPKPEIFLCHASTGIV